MLVPNTYIIKYDMETKENNIEDVLKHLLYCISYEEYEFNVKVELNNFMISGSYSKVIDRFLHEAVDTKSGIYCCYANLLSTKELFIKFCTDFIVEFFEQKNVGKEPKNDTIKMVGSTYVGTKQCYYSNYVNYEIIDKYYSKEELDEFIVMRDVTMPMVNQEFSAKYMLVPFYLNLINEHLIDDDKVNNFSKYVILYD